MIPKFTNTKNRAEFEQRLKSFLRLHPTDCLDWAAGFIASNVTFNRDRNHDTYSNYEHHIRSNRHEYNDLTREYAKKDYSHLINSSDQPPETRTVITHSDPFEKANFLTNEGRAEVARLSTEYAKNNNCSFAEGFTAITSKMNILLAKIEKEDPKRATLDKQIRDYMQSHNTTYEKAYSQILERN